MRSAKFELAPRGITEVNVVGGGEPLVHPDCLEIMREVKRHGWRVHLISNASLLSLAMARAMVAMGWDPVRVSVHAGDAETYARGQGVDHFERVRERVQHDDRVRCGAGVVVQCRSGGEQVPRRRGPPTTNRRTPSCRFRTRPRSYCARARRTRRAGERPSGGPDGGPVERIRHAELSPKSDGRR